MILISFLLLFLPYQLLLLLATFTRVIMGHHLIMMAGKQGM